MKNHIFVFSIILGVTFLFSACSKQESVVFLSPLASSVSSSGVDGETNTGVKSVEMEADTDVNPQTIDELEELCPYVLEGVLSDDGEQTVYTINSDGKLPYYGETVSTLNVTKVYNGNLSTEDSVKLVEPYFLQNTPEGKEACHLGNYMLTVSGKKYLFFLKKSSKKANTYCITLCEKSRYPVPSEKFDRRSIQTQTNEELNLGSENSEDYKALYEKVLDKYYP